MQELKDKLDVLTDEIARAVTYVDIPALDLRIRELEAETMSDIFWNDQKRAKHITTELSHLMRKRDLWLDLQKRCKDSLDLIELYFEDESHSEADRSELKQEVFRLEEEFKHASIELFMGGEYDEGNAIVSIFSGAGGVDAQDWVGMLLRMYLRYAERKGYKTEILHKTEGEIGGVKHVTFTVEGPLAYGFLKEEKGVHRLVRLSPFNSGNTRETSFALVEILPEVEEASDDIVIDDKDLRIDTYRSGGAGGQHLNKTSSAVRVFHIPTGIFFACQNERSQHQNKDRAMSMLKGKLAQLKKEQQVEKIEDLKGDLGKNEWGHQIRSYVLHPYKMVKDLRTAYETSQVEDVLDGDLDEMIEAGLTSKEK